MAGVIAVFDGEYRFLSNFYERDVDYDGYMHRSNECAFQSMKLDDREQRRGFCRLAAHKAKAEGRTVKLRPDWDHLKTGFMSEIVHAKFVQNPDLVEKLLATGDAELIEGNWWHDTFWGICNGEGENWLGRILMAERAYWRMLRSTAAVKRDG
jgi:ribA/ribD-fused uncharacterized protein